MSKRRNRLLQKRFFVFLLFYASFWAAIAESALLPAVKALAEKAFAQKNTAAVSAVFQKGIDSLPQQQAQCQALRLWADYETHAGAYSEAASHYRQAAKLCSDNELLLHAIKAQLCGGDFEAARRSLKEIFALLPQTEADRRYRTAAVYTAWLLLAEDTATRAIPLLKRYAEMQAFAEYHPALLFTLWWADADENAKRRLLQEFPNSIEAKTVRGESAVAPSVFWYFMPKTERAFQPLSGIGSTNMPDAQPAGGVPLQKNTRQNEQVRQPAYYQLGFYRTKSYADNLAAELRKKHFIPIIKEEMRPSGTLYFAVLVEENRDGDIGLRLRDAGYEAFPVFP